jgi:ferric iron reductase protein FhuF
MSGELNTHPLASMFQRLAAIDANLRAEGGIIDEDWQPVNALCQADSELLEGCLRHTAKPYRPDLDRRTMASFFLGEYAYYLLAPLICGYLSEHRVPSFAPEEVAFRSRAYTWREGDESGEATRFEVRFVGARFACLVDDPFTADPNAHPLADESALLDWMRDEIIHHFAALIAQVSDSTGLSEHALWLIVADSCNFLFLNIGKGLRITERAQEISEQFIRAAESPLKNPKTRFLTLEYAGHRDTFCVRGGCCRYYTVSDAAEKCSTCVLRPPEEQNTKLLAHLSRKYAAETISQESTT